MLFYHLYLLPLPAFTLLLMSIWLQRYPIVVFFLLMTLLLMAGLLLLPGLLILVGLLLPRSYCIPADTPVGELALKAS
jgi:hypothetical protein